MAQSGVWSAQRNALHYTLLPGYLNVKLTLWNDYSQNCPAVPLYSRFSSNYFFSIFMLKNNLLIKTRVEVATLKYLRGWLGFQRQRTVL